MRTKVLVTGGNGQLAQTIHSIANQFPSLDVTITNSKELDITSKKGVEQFFDINKISWCINCAAYTAVDNAENESEKAYEVNGIGVKLLADSCKKFNTKLIHISTDFVFDGNKQSPYNESDLTNPQTVYGRSKLEGENWVISTLEHYFIIRTSWLYSEFGNNFLKTMLRLGETKENVNVVNDQIGSPTYSRDLTVFIMKIIERNSNAFGLYHYCNLGEVSWFEFAKSIFEIAAIKTNVNPISTENYPTTAKRPHYSVLNISKAQQTFDEQIPFWKDSLKKAIKNLE